MHMTFFSIHVGLLQFADSWRFQNPTISHPPSRGATWLVASARSDYRVTWRIGGAVHWAHLPWAFRPFIVLARKQNVEVLPCAVRNVSARTSKRRFLSDVYVCWDWGGYRLHLTLKILGLKIATIGVAFWGLMIDHSHLDNMHYVLMMRNVQDWWSHYFI